MPSCLWEAHTVERRRAWHDITALGRHARSNDIGRGMTSPPLDSTDNRQRRAWHDITAIRQHTVRRRQAWHAIIAFRQHRRSDDVGRGMPSPPLDITHSQMTSGIACHHCPSTTHTVGRRRAWHDITALGQHAWSDGVRQGMTSSPLGRTHDRTTSGVA